LRNDLAVEFDITVASQSPAAGATSGPEK
jgi:hypothetical protein